MDFLQNLHIAYYTKNYPTLLIRVRILPHPHHGCQHIPQLPFNLTRHDAPVYKRLSLVTFPNSVHNLINDAPTPIRIAKALKRFD